MVKIKRASLVFLCLVVLLNCLVGCSAEKTAAVKMPAEVYENDSDWSTEDGGTVTLENGSVRLRFDCATTHFTVEDLRSGKSYSSVPEIGGSSLSDENAERLRSELTLTYYKQQSEAEFMYSAKDSVDGGNFRVLKSGDAVRVYYSFGENADKYFAPHVFKKEDFEKLVLSKLENTNEKRRISGYYRLYGDDKSASGYSEMLEKYPSLKKNKLYILEAEDNENALSEITDFMTRVGYTREQYDKIVKELDITVSGGEKAGFTIPVEYRLCSDGFTATVLSGMISENSAECRLQSVDFLEYFAARGNDSAGYYVVPDGSGTLIKINGSYKTDFSQSFYGTDFSTLGEGGKTYRNLMLPIYGISESDGGILAIVESAAEVAKLNIKTIGNSAPTNHIYTDFTLKAVDVTDIGEKTNVPVYNIFSNHRLKISPKIKFVLLESGRAEFTDMAEYYRNYLLENKGISERKTENTPLYLDYLCMILKPASVMGVSYNKKTVLSTVSEITETVKKLIESGVNGIAVRLRGYGAGGLTNKAYNRFEIDPKVGSVKEFEALSEILRKNGGELYLDADFQFVYSGGNGFSKKNSAAHYLNRAVVYNGGYDIVTGRRNSLMLPCYFVSPTAYSEYSLGFLRSAEKKFSKGKQPSVSFGSAGRYLGSDYATKNDMDRAESLYCLKNALTETGKTAMFDNGNAYVLPFAKALVNVPLTSSAVDMEYMRIPIYQMIIHGLIPYCGAPLNLAADPERHYLQSAEYGAALSATLITRENSLLTGTDYESVYYSLNDSEQLEGLISRYKNTQEYLKKVNNAAITGYERLAESLYCTRYANGIKVLVNYGETVKAAYGRQVKAMSFSVIYE